VPLNPSERKYTDMTTETTGLIALIPENIPEELKERPQWVCWRYEERDEKLTKVPFAPHTGSYASSTDLMTWAAFGDTLAAYRASEGFYSGIGFVFSSADPYVGIDLDKCRNPETGEIKPWARKIIDRVREGYIEASPSGTGVHAVVEGVMRGQKTQRELSGGKIEMYCQERFFTVTGAVL
jgi:putative DNA primase/helicase